MTQPARTDGRAGGRRKSPRKATPQHLENAALHYLERFATSEANLRRVLMRKIERSARFHDTDRGEGAAAVEDIIARFRRSRLLDDAAYAEGRARSLFLRGASARKIRMALIQKGVGEDEVNAALARLFDEAAEPELAAAVTLARKRRLGPFRRGDRAAMRERDLASLARAGFSYDIARRVIEAEDSETLEAEANAIR